MNTRPLASSTIGDLTRAVSLKGVFPNASFVGCGDVRVSSVSSHSSLVKPQGAFVVISGSAQDGSQYIPEALENGASALIVESPRSRVSVPQCIVKDSRAAYGKLASLFAGQPSRKLAVAAVTGTNGKTSTNWILRSIVQAGFGRCGMLGTIEYHDGQRSEPATLTTPAADVLQSWFQRMVRNRCDHAVIEASSHALSQSRLIGTSLSAAVITNVTQDHLDYHKHEDDYIRAKARIGNHLASEGWLFVNSDDPGAVRAGILSGHRNLKTFGMELPADINGRVIEESLRGSRFAVREDGIESLFSTPLIGRHQVANCLAAIAVARHWGIDDAQIQKGLSQLRTIPGRLQKIDNNRGIDLFVDYAHTPDALNRSLEHLSRLSSGRLIVVFGAGGDRDRTKRPLMGQVACQADLAVVTSDNPRSENPEQILDEILSGMPVATSGVHREVDRAAAIQWALDAASTGDVVLVAGKGHEQTQTIGETILRFDDAEVIRDYLTRRTHSFETPSVSYSS